MGLGLQKLMEESNTATSYLGLSCPNRKVKSLPGKPYYIHSFKGSNFLASGYCHQDKCPARRLPDTLTGQRLPPSHTQPFQMYKTSEYVNLFNGDKCAIGQHVVVQHQLGSSEQFEDMPPTFIAHVFEIIQKVGSTLQCPTDSVRNPVILPEWHRNGTGIHRNDRIPPEWHRNDLIPPEWHWNGTGIRHKGLIGSPKLT